MPIDCLPGAKKYTGSRPGALTPIFCVNELYWSGTGLPNKSLPLHLSLPRVNKLSNRTVDIVMHCNYIPEFGY